MGELSHYLSEMQEKLCLIEPNLGEVEARRMILPRQLGDLDNPEFIDSLRRKIQLVNDIQKRFKDGAINRDDYYSQIKYILSSPLT